MTDTLSGAVLVLGGARSGKSAFAEQLVAGTGRTRHYVATGRAWDEEMRERIARHRLDRGEGWETHEEPIELVRQLELLNDPANVILVDCLTLWVTNLMMEERVMAEEFARLAAYLPKMSANLVIVSNEVGMGIVPENRMARDFRDHAGRLHQAVAASASEVYFVAAGLPLKMKG
jgi:adenosylcobinamide kinase/adenosylcobinamide-phosphate guanylyltransferase